MISKTQITDRTKRKSNIDLIKTINKAKKNNLIDLAKRLSGPKRQQKKINLDQLNKEDSNKILVVGKILGSGDINKKISISALGFSSQAKEKLKKAGCDIRSINEEIENNPKLNGVKII
jgi:large subunit ribosomal protein L18e